MEEQQLLMQIRDALIQIDKSLDDKWKQLETWKNESEMLVESRWKLVEKWVSMSTDARSDLKDIRDRIVLFVKL